jgi:hypothetical protein
MLKGSVSLLLAVGHTTVAVISKWFSIGRSDVRRCLLGAIMGGTPRRDTWPGCKLRPKTGFMGNCGQTVVTNPEETCATLKSATT